MAALKRSFSDARIDWLVQDSFAPAIVHHPDLARVIPFYRRRLGSWHTPGVTGELRRFLRSLREAEYDLVLDCQGLARSALFAWATRAPVRIGYANAKEFGWLGLTRGGRVLAPRTMHTVDRMMLLAHAAGCPKGPPDLRLYSGEAERAGARKLLGTDGAAYAVLAPTTRWAGKLWPPERFVELAKRLLGDRSLGIERLVVVGSESEREQCAGLLALAGQDSRIVDLVGRTGVGELLAVIEGSRLVIGSDSAAVHIAVGFSRPLVALYGPTRVDLVGPYGRSGQVVQRLEPGDRIDHKDALAGAALMERITVEMVVERARGETVRR